MSPSAPHVVDDRTRRLVAEACAPVVAAAPDPAADAAAERARASFDSDEVAAFLAGGADKLARRRELVALLQRQPWGDKAARPFLTREQEYVGGLAAGVGIWRLMREHRLPLEDGAEMRNLLNWPGGFELHIGMFMPSIMSQGTPEQQAEWLPRCARLQVIGTYAQTELGHGTYVRGLETVAVYDPPTREFVLHSPTLTATKWWPGGLGKTATHAVVMARLVTGGRDRGPHAFVVPLRDAATHRPLPGVALGDIGPKMGYNGVDNGHLRFDHVRAPRSAMLARYAQVAEDGGYSPPPPANAKAAYATMVYVRATIVRDAGEFLGRAATIAVRYAAVRRQTAPAPGERELQVLDYDNVRQVLLPLAAQAYALRLAGRWLYARYEAFDAARDAGDFSSLPELHALSAGLKAYCTGAAADGIEAARRACGGHGYSALSGLPVLYASYVQNVTWEGDNAVMFLQTARWLLKAAAAAAAARRPPPGSAAYLGASGGGEAEDARSAAATAADWADPAHQVAALRAAARAAVRAARAALAASAAARGVPAEAALDGGAAWNDVTVDLVAAARAHSVLVVHEALLAGVADAARALSAPAAAALRRVAALHGAAAVADAAPALLEAGHVAGGQAAAARAARRALCADLRPDALALVDGLGHEDYVLASALGRRDGDVYRALLGAAARSPLNASEEGPGWAPVLRALLDPAARGGGGGEPRARM